MSEKFRPDRKIGFQNKFHTKCINVIIDSIGPSIILRSILRKELHFLGLLQFPYHIVIHAYYVFARHQTNLFLVCLYIGHIKKK